MTWAESSTGMTGVHTLPSRQGAQVISQRLGMSSMFAAELRSNAKCVEVIAEADTLRLARFKEETTGEFGVPMMKAPALMTSRAREIPKDLRMSVFAVSIQLNE